MHTNILKYAGAHHLWTSIGLVALSLAVFLTQGESKPPSGNTWQGYVLGAVATLLIVWLNLLGVRKRRYGVPGQVEGWLSAHVYFGVALFFIVLLHSAGQIGWNVHTAAFALMTIAILSGMVGTCFYLLVPPQMAEIRQGGSLQKLARRCAASIRHVWIEPLLARRRRRWLFAAASSGRSSAAAYSISCLRVISRHTLVWRRAVRTISPRRGRSRIATNRLF